VGDPWNFVDRTGWGPEKELNEATSDSEIWPSLTVGACAVGDENCLSVTLYFPAHRKSEVARLVTEGNTSGPTVGDAVEYLIQVFGGAVNSVSGSISVFLVPNDEDEQDWFPQLLATVQAVHPEMSDQDAAAFVTYAIGQNGAEHASGGTVGIGPSGVGIQSIVYVQLAPAISFGPNETERRRTDVLGTLVHELSHVIFNANGVYSENAESFGDDALHSLIYSIAEHWKENVSGTEVFTRFDILESGDRQGPALDSALGRLANVQLPGQRIGILRREVDNALNSNR
jgi:hypothetical protein